MEHKVDITKEVNTTPEKAYSAFTDPGELSTWFTTNAKADLRPGGKYSNGDKDQGEFIEIVPNEKVRFTWENQGHCPGTEVEVRFEKADDNKTLIKLQHTKLPDEAGMMDMKKGWTWALTSAKSYLETGKPITYGEWEKNNPDLNTD